MVRKRMLLLLVALASGMVLAAPAPAPDQRFDINQTVVKIPLAEGVSADDAILAIQSKAAALNMKSVGHQPLSQELAARGIESGRLEIFQFCNPEDAYAMVKFNPVFAAYMPCRIVLVEDTAGKTWLMMINLDMLINNAELSPEVRTIAERVNQTLLTIIHAGARGDF
jgi:uncharacterized protein (DUF302 family)